MQSFVNASLFLNIFSKKLHKKGLSHQDGPFNPVSPVYFSTTSSTSIGQAFAHIPHAIHLLVTGESSAFTITWNGQTSTHLPQPVQSFLLIMYTPFAFSVIAPASQAFAHFPHCTQTDGFTTPFFSTIWIQDFPGSITL